MSGDWKIDKKGRYGKRFEGQGVVEYAGALVIAAGIIAAGIIIVPPNFASMINNFYTSMASFLVSQMPT